MDDRKYNMRHCDGGWTVYSVDTDIPVLVDGSPQSGMGIEDASDLVDLLNRMAMEPEEAAFG